MLVFDTSAYINGWRDHLPPATFPGVWTLVDVALEDGRVISPREVYNDLQRQDDELAAWAHERERYFVLPSEEIQRAAGVLHAEFGDHPFRNASDPWVVAEAQAREWCVVTYEGRTFSGVPIKNWQRSMPGICQQYQVDCATLPEALARLGGEFHHGAS